MFVAIYTHTHMPTQYKNEKALCINLKEFQLQESMPKQNKDCNLAAI